MPTSAPRSISKDNLRAWTSVVRTYQLCSDTLISRLKPLELTLPMFEVLVSLLGTPNQAQQQLVDRSFIVKSHMSGLLANMEERGWITREAGQADKRSKLVALTAAGTNLAKKAATIQIDVISAMIAPLSQKQIYDMEATMRIVAAALVELENE
jgi:DNA-binding MarR family transcriptional regulator